MTIKSKLTDPIAVLAACQRLNLPAPEHGTAKLYGGEVTGLIVRLPDWTYPAVIDIATGEVHFDTFGGAWGDPVHFARFLQLYAVEKAKFEARAKGLAVTEQALNDGSIRVQIMEA